MNKNIEVKEVVNVEEKKIKLNVSYLDFIKVVIDNNLLNGEKKILIDNYLEIVKVRSFRNIKKVSGRVLRKELRSLVLSELESRKIELKNYLEIDKLVKERLGENKKVSNYISL